jgi:hypothetical protein
MATARKRYEASRNMRDRRGLGGPERRRAIPQCGKISLPRRRNTWNFKGLFRNTRQQTLNGMNVTARLD